MLSIGTRSIGDVEGGRQFPTTVVVEEEVEILPVVVFVSEEVGKNRSSEKLLHFRLRLREPMGEPQKIKVVEDGFPEVGVQKSCGRDVVNASCGRPVKTLHPEPVRGLGAPPSLRTFKESPRGRADAGLLRRSKGRGFEESSLVAKRKVGSREFDEPSRGIFLRDE